MASAEFEKIRINNFELILLDDGSVAERVTLVSQKASAEDFELLSPLGSTFGVGTKLRCKIGRCIAGDKRCEWEGEGIAGTDKIMKYDPGTGHRIKDGKTKGRINWVHSLMKYTNALPQDWQLTQCLFGEHLLPEYPDKPVALVESEKTAVICAAMMPEYIWLATGGKSQFNERLNVLQSRDIIAFPDVDGYETWTEKAAFFPHLNIKVSNLLQKNATEEEREQHIDIADWLVKWNLEPKPESSSHLNRTFQKVARYVSPEFHEQLLGLIEDLDLEVWDLPQH